MLRCEDELTDEQGVAAGALGEGLDGTDRKREPVGNREHERLGRVRAKGLELDPGPGPPGVMKLDSPGRVVTQISQGRSAGFAARWTRRKRDASSSQ